MCIVPRRKEEDSLEKRVAKRTGHQVSVRCYSDNAGEVMVVCIAKSPHRPGVKPYVRPTIHNMSVIMVDNAEGWQEFEEHCVRSIPNDT